MERFHCITLTKIINNEIFKLHLCGPLKEKINESTQKKAAYGPGNRAYVLTTVPESFCWKVFIEALV